MANHGGLFLEEPWRTEAKSLGVYLTEEECIQEMKMIKWKFVPDPATTKEDRDEEEASDDEEDPAGGGRSRPKSALRYIQDQQVSVRTVEDYQDFAEEHCDKMREYVESKTATPLLDLVSAILGIKNWKLWTKLLLDIAQASGRNLLVDQKKDTKNTCLHEAVIKHDDDPLYTHFLLFLGTFANDADFSTALAIDNGRKETCLHTAIALVDNVNLQKLQLVCYLTDKAGADTVVQKRGRTDRDDPGSGNTCLHDLLDMRLCKGLERRCPNPIESCKRCRERASAALWETYCEQYMLLIDKMTVKHPEVVRTWNDALQSPFLYHEFTKAAIKDKKAWIGSSHSKDVPSKAEELAKLQIPPPPSPIRSREKSALRQESRSSASGSRSKETVDQSDRPSKNDKNNKADSVPQPKHKGDTAKYSKVLSKMATDKLVEHCLAQDDFVDVCESLFGQDYPRAELTFKAAPLTDKTCDIHDSLPLDSILADVELGLVDPSLPAQDTQKSTDLLKMRKKQRRDREDREHLVKDFFQWLRKRNVKKIIKLAVYDASQMPCRDEVIEECLRGFDIRYLDWDKDDLSVSELSKDVTPRLKELWLSWSGRNTALLGWSNREHGLRTLPYLKTVHIATYTEWESPETYRRNILTFKEALKDKIKVVDSDEADPSFDAVVRDDLDWQGLSNRNLWLDSIKMFRKAVDEKISKELREKARVSVAVIDTGVQLSDLESTKNIKGCWYVDKKKPHRRSMNAWYVAEKKHGTEMIRLIRLVCPYAEIYVAKLDIDKLVYKSIAESAAEAIKAAIAQKVNVISMSWTVYKDKDNGESQKGIDNMMKAISEAGRSPLNTIMFCAAEDEGSVSKKQPYPATGCNPQILKRVGSASAYGEAAEYVNQSDIDYLFPGELTLGPDKPASGSSVATSLASGLAALVLWCESLQNVSTAAGVSNGVAGVTGPLPNEGRLLRRPTGRLEETHFQDHTNMYGLFNKLRDPKGNQLVNVTEMLKRAAKDSNPPKKLIELAKQEIGKLA